MFYINTACPGWKDANDALEVERVDAAWIEDIVTDNSFVIVKVHMLVLSCYTSISIYTSMY